MDSFSLHAPDPPPGDSTRLPLTHPINARTKPRVFPSWPGKTVSRQGDALRAVLPGAAQKRGVISEADGRRVVGALAADVQTFNAELRGECGLEVE